MDTLEQLLAQSLDRHLTITANAGSGKTRVLVQRYVNILLENYRESYLPDDTTACNPRHIVAITFTRKAASEMLAKVVRNIESRFKDATTPADLRKLKEIRQELTYARISTIHSFCTSLLREFPIEADVSPVFVELSESDLLSLKRNSTIAILEEWLEDRISGKRAKAVALFRLLGRKNIEIYISRILSKPDIYDQLIDFYSRPDDIIIAERNRHLVNVFLLPMFSAVKDLCIHMDTINEAKLGAKTSEKYRIVSSLLDKYRSMEGINLESDKEIFDFINDINEIVSQIFTSKGAVNSYISKGFESPETAGRAAKLFIRFDALDSIKEALANDDKEDNLIEIVRILLEITSDVKVAFEEEKSLLGGLDFEDMLIKTLKLMNNDNVRKQVRKKIKYMLVDEFQDTNQIQYEIIKRLVPEIEMPAIDDGSINVFIVGDAKQSIYGFRNADVRVFEQARQDIRVLNAHRLDKRLISSTYITPGGMKRVEEKQKVLGDLSLTATFRLQPVPAAFVNRVCGNVMRERDTDYDVAYTDLVCARSISEIEQHAATGTVSLPGSVTFLLRAIDKKEESDNNTSETDDKYTEAELAARYIRNLIDAPGDVGITDSDGIKRKPKYGDIAILARKRKCFGSLVEAFLKYKIPYVVHSGTGFYEAQEVVDVISCLNFLHNRNDNLSLAAILRSPFFALNDTELYIISRQKNSRTLWDKLKFYCETNINRPSDCIYPEGSYLSNIHRAFEILSELSLMTNGISIPRLILMILDKTGWYGTLAGTPGRSQVEANIEKLLQHARDFESKGFRTLYDYVEELNFITSSSLNESEAAFLTGEDAVNIMTVHAAKGLEFPIVVLFAAHETTNISDNFFISAETGIAFPLPTMIDNLFFDSVNTLSYILASRRQSLIDMAEEKRILYVALTRTIEHLVISATVRKGSESVHGMIGMICNGLDMDINTILECETFMLNDRLPVLKENAVEWFTIDYPVKIIQKIDDIFVVPPAISDDSYLPPILLGTIDPSIDNEVFSATRISTYESGFNDYISKYLLGLPQEEDKFSDTVFIQDKDDEGLTGTQPGILIHKVLEDLHLWYMPDGSIDKDLLNEVINSAIDSEGRHVSKELRDRVFSECHAVASTLLLKEIAPNIRLAQPEYELSMPIANNFITGKIDFLVVNSKGEREIWDWKTNLVPGDSVMESLAAHYELQMKIYAWFVSLLFMDQKEVTARLLFTRLAAEFDETYDWMWTYQWSRDELAAFGIELTTKISEIQKTTYWLDDN